MKIIANNNNHIVNDELLIDYDKYEDKKIIFIYFGYKVFWEFKDEEERNLNYNRLKVLLEKNTIHIMKIDINDYM